MSFPDTNEDVIVDIEDEASDDVIVEVVDDRPEEDRVPPRDPSKITKTDFDDESLDDQLDDDTNAKRLNRARFEYHEVRRAKEEAERVREEAIRYAESIQKENEELKNLVHSGERVLVDTMKSRSLTDIEQAEQQLRRAYEEDDTEAIVANQKALFKAQLDAEKANSYIQAEVKPTTKFTPSAPQTPAPGAEDPVLKEWISKNEWFGKDDYKTKIAMIEHERVQAAGETIGDAEYYKKIDRVISRISGDDGAAEPVKRTQVVAPSTRTQTGPGARSKRTVTLTASEAKVADKLGVPRHIYAAQKLKEQQKDG